MAKDIYRYYRQEAHELVEQLSRGLQRMSQGACSPEEMNALLRAAHTLKGASQLVKQREIAEKAHSIESWLNRAFNENTPPVISEVEALLKLNDEIINLLSALQPVPQQSATDLSQAQPVEEPAVSENVLHTIRADLKQVDGLLQHANEAHVSLSELRAGLAELEKVRSLASMLVAITSGPGAPMLSGRNRTVPVSIAQEINTLLQQAKRGLQESHERAEREIIQLRNAAENLRVVPAERIFPLLEHAVRDSARATAKIARFVASGGEIQLDAHVLALVKDGLVQLLRNAVVHGIEASAVRRQAGKAPQGIVELLVTRHRNRIAFEVKDDGAGIDVNALRIKAEKRGWADEQALAQSTQEQVLNLIFRPGVTTREKPDELSGRGIGLDIVRTVVNRLKGEVHVQSQPGIGTSVQIQVPVSLASASALLVGAGGASYAIPLDCVKQTLSMRDAAFLGGKFLYQDQAVPYVTLRQAMGAKTSHGAESTEGASVAAILHHPDGLMVLGVDVLQGIHVMLVHQIPRFVDAEPFVSGVTMDAKGVPVLVIDPAGLLKAALRNQADESSVPARKILPLLVIDDSMTTRMLEQSIFQTAGYEVDVAMSAEEGLEMARQKRYGLFLVDIEMPGIDGFSFVQTTQQDSEMRRVPAILVTSRNSPQDRARGIQVGARDYVVKSEFDQGYLLARVKELMAQE